MLITVNNQSVPVPAVATLQGLLVDLDIQDQKGLAIAVNQQVIPKKNWSGYVIRENDQVTIIRATQGG